MRSTEAKSVGSPLVDDWIERVWLPGVERDGALPLLGTRLPVDVDGVGGAAVCVALLSSGIGSVGRTSGEGTVRVTHVCGLTTVVG